MVNELGDKSDNLENIKQKSDRSLELQAAHKALQDTQDQPLTLRMPDNPESGFLECSTAQLYASTISLSFADNLLQKYASDDLIAGNPIQDAEKSLEKFWYPRRDNPNEGLDDKVCSDSYKAAHLGEFGIDPLIIAASLRNENIHRKQLDSGEEMLVKQFGALPLDVTIGDAQMKQSIIKYLVTRYSQLEHMRQDPLRMSMDHRNSALLVGAYFQETAHNLMTGQDPIPWYSGAHANEIRQKIKTLWASGNESERTDALIRSFNPGEGQTHVNNVRNQMKELRQL